MAARTSPNVTFSQRHRMVFVRRIGQPFGRQREALLDALPEDRLPFERAANDALAFRRDRQAQIGKDRPGGALAGELGDIGTADRMTVARDIDTLGHPALAVMGQNPLPEGAIETRAGPRQLGELHLGIETEAQAHRNRKRDVA